MAVFEFDDSLEAFLDAGVYDFEWDSGNRGKNWKRHRVTARECEEVFFLGALPVGAQVYPPANEPRYGVIGETPDRAKARISHRLKRIAQNGGG